MSNDISIPRSFGMPPSVSSRSSSSGADYRWFESDELGAGVFEASLSPFTPNSTVDSIAQFILGNLIEDTSCYFG